MARIVAGVSGGVDSAVATARLLDAGHEVTAVHLVLQHATELVDAQRLLAAAEEARRVAERLGVPFETWDLADDFEAQVLDYFVGEYAAGRTPNPCARCNRTIKFGVFLRRAQVLGYDGLATGHYARIVRAAGDGVELHRAADLPKDQSYVLAVLGQDQLRRVVLPLGGSTKAEVRAEAAKRGLPVAAKAESMDLCFIPDGDTARWLQGRLGAVPGDIVDESGEVLGRHEGTYRYTVGQRKGLNLRRPAADGEPRFVLGLDAAKRQVVVGPREHLAVTRLVAGPVVWTSGVTPGEPFAASVQVRAHGEQYPATVTRLDDEQVQIDVRSPIIGVAPGQLAVLYEGTRVVASATINLAASQLFNTNTC